LDRKERGAEKPKYFAYLANALTKARRASTFLADASAESLFLGIALELSVSSSRFRHDASDKLVSFRSFTGAFSA